MGAIKNLYNKVFGKEDEKLKKVQDIVNKLTEKKRFVSTTGGDNLGAKEEIPSKSYKNLKVLFSEAPGAIQCGNVIRNRILAGGFMIVPTDSEGEINENDKEYQRLKEFSLTPNKDETLEDIWSGMIQNYLMYGNSFLEKVMSEGGETVEEVYLLNTQKMKILLDEEKHRVGIDIATGYTRELEKKFGKTSGKIKYELDEVCHFRRPSPEGSLYGQAVLENHTAVLSMVIQALTYNVTFLRNDGKGPMQIVLPEGSTHDEAIALKEYMDKEYSGSYNAGKTLVLFGGAEAKDLGTSLKDMDYLNLMIFCKKEVAGMFGVPLVMISDPEGSNRASSIEERKGFHVNNILPEREKLLRKFNREVIKNGLGVDKYELGIEELDIEEQGKRSTEAKEALAGGLATPNEAATYAGWETVEEDWADQKYIIAGAGASAIPFSRAIDIEQEQSDAKRALAENSGKVKEDKDKDKDKKDKDKKKEKEEKKSVAISLNELRKKVNKHLGY